MKRQREHDYKQPRYKKRRTSTSKLGYNSGRVNPRPNRLELKAFDVVAANTPFPAAGGSLILNAVPLGTDYFQRVGRKITMKSLHIKGTIVPTQAVGADYLRVMIIYDAQCNKALPATNNLILLDANAAPATTSFSEINLNNRERFKILRDKRFASPGCASTTVGLNLDQTMCMNINEFIKLKGLDTMYDATNGGTAADITSGSLFILLISTNTNNLWNFNFQTRLRYYD